MSNSLRHQERRRKRAKQKAREGHGNVSLLAPKPVVYPQLLSKKRARIVNGEKATMQSVVRPEIKL